MLIEIVDVLRCPKAHEETWLVASVDRSEGRRIIDGTLGCPICHSEYPIQRGVADFSGDAAPHAASATATVDDAIRLAALLELTPGPGFALLFGVWGQCAALISDVSPVPMLLVNPPHGVEAGEGISIMLTGDVLPLSSGRARAGAIDPTLTLPLEVQSGAVRAGGRIVGPAMVPPPVGVREIARDEKGWVAENGVPASAPITLMARPR